MTLASRVTATIESALLPDDDEEEAVGVTRALEEEGCPEPNKTLVVREIFIVKFLI